VKKPNKPTKQKRTTTTTTITLERSIPTPTPTSQDLQRVHNTLLARHAVLHSAMESFNLLRPGDRASRIPLLRTCYDAVREALTDATGTANHAKETLSRADLAELHRTVATLTRALPEYQRQIDRYQ
jgi:hypothetical protein